MDGGQLLLAYAGKPLQLFQCIIDTLNVNFKYFQEVLQFAWQMSPLRLGLFGTANTR